jgi:hypothetical protein
MGDILGQVLGFKAQGSGLGQLRRRITFGQLSGGHGLSSCSG